MKKLLNRILKSVNQVQAHEIIISFLKSHTRDEATRVCNIELTDTEADGYELEIVYQTKQGKEIIAQILGDKIINKIE